MPEGGVEENEHSGKIPVVKRNSYNTNRHAATVYDNEEQLQAHAL